MRKLHFGTTALLALAVLAQFFLAGRGTMIADFEPHRALGYLTVLLTGLTLVAALLARLRGRVLALTGMVAVLVLLQPVLASLAREVDAPEAGGLLLGLHAANGAVVLGLLGLLLNGSRQVRRKTASPGRAPAAAGS